jgi:hypothetical protein
MNETNAGAALQWEEELTLEGLALKPILTPELADKLRWQLERRNAQGAPSPLELAPGIDRVLVPLGWRLWGRMAGWAGVIAKPRRVTLKGKRGALLAQMLADGRATIVREH